MRKIIQQGFTLIKWMVVVVIIGILASVALPVYQDYTNLALVAQGLSLAGAAKVMVIENAATGTEFGSGYGGSLGTKNVLGLSPAPSVLHQATPAELAATFATVNSGGIDVDAVGNIFIGYEIPVSPAATNRLVLYSTADNAVLVMGTPSVKNIRLDCYFAGVATRTTVALVGRPTLVPKYSPGECR